MIYEPMVFYSPAAIERYPIYQPANIIGWWSLVGIGDRAESSGLRDAFTASDQGDADLPAHEESESSSDSVGTSEPSEYCQILW